MPKLAISDDGPSIPVAERQRIFERFHRLLGTQEDGSGLGLAIVSEIATLHGARIELEEDVDGVGNTFSVTFDARDTAGHREDGLHARAGAEGCQLADSWPTRSRQRTAGSQRKLPGLVASAPASGSVPFHEETPWLSCPARSSGLRFRRSS